MTTPTYRITNLSDKGFIVRENGSNRCWKKVDGRIHWRSFVHVLPDSDNSDKLAWLFNNRESEKITIKIDDDGNTYMECLPMIIYISLENLFDDVPESVFDGTEHEVAMMKLQISTSNRFLRLDKEVIKQNNYKAIMVPFVYGLWFGSISQHLPFSAPWKMFLLIAGNTIVSICTHYHDKYFDDDNFAWSIINRFLGR